MLDWLRDRLLDGGNGEKSALYFFSFKLTTTTTPFQPQSGAYVSIRVYGSVDSRIVLAQERLSTLLWEILWK